MKIRFYKHNKTYGGGEFITLDTENNTFIEGNTASTAWNCWECHPYQTTAEVSTYKELARIKQELENAGATSRGRK